MKPDRKGHVITAQRPDGALLSSNIDRVTQERDLIVFDGVQNGLSWTMTIAGSSGHMSLSAIGDGEPANAPSVVAAVSGGSASEKAPTLPSKSPRPPPCAPPAAAQSPLLARTQSHRDAIQEQLEWLSESACSA